MVAFVLHSFACGASKRKATGPDPCKMGEQHLRQRIGPEFGRIAAKAVTGIKRQFNHGCALVYTRLAEELPEEISDDSGLVSPIDHRLALMLLTEKGSPRFIKIARGRGAPGPVSMTIDARDANGDGIPDFVVQERASVKGDTLDYQNLRIIDGAGTSGRFLFDRPLRMKTTEGLELIARWSLTERDRAQYLLMQGGGQTLTFVFDQTTRRFRQLENQKTPAKASSKAQGSANKTKTMGVDSETQGPKIMPDKSKSPAPQMEQFLIED